MVICTYIHNFFGSFNMFSLNMVMDVIFLYIHILIQKDTIISGKVIFVEICTFEIMNKILIIDNL